MINRYYKKNKAKIKYRNKYILFIVFTLILFFLLDLSLKQNIKKSIEYQCKIIATNIISEKNLLQMEKLNVTYNELININRDNKNKITSIETNIAGINKIKFSLSNSVTNSLNEIKIKEYEIPLGTLLGISHLSGRGPNVKLRIAPYGYLNSEIISQFKSVGINQTSHQIILNQTMDLTAFIPLHNKDVKLETNLIIAETIIVGEVPEYYTNVISDDKQKIADINDYSIKK